ncbi:HNH endonuclease [Campylobacter coli]
MSYNLRLYYKDFLKVDFTNKKYSVVVDGVEYEKPNKWFINLIKYDIKLPEGYKDRLKDLEFVKQIKYGNYGNITNIIPIFTTPVYHKEMKDFRMIAKHPTYFIDRNGNVYDSVEGITITPNRNTEYASIVLRDDRVTDDKVKEAIHRLVAITWVENPDWLNKNIVDHIDGDKKNFSANNLRWLTYQENALAATYQGLRPDNIPVLVKNIDTEAVLEFPSFTEACKYIGRSKMYQTVSDLRPGKIWRGTAGKFEIKLKTDTNGWYFDKYEVASPKLVRYIFKVTMPMLDGTTRTHVFKSPRDAHINLTKEDCIGLLDNTVIEILRSLYPNYKFEYAKVEGYEAYDGEREYKAPTVQALANLIDIPKSTILKYIKTEKKYGVWMFRRSCAINEPWKYTEDYEAPVNAPIGIKLTDVTKNESKVYTSLRNISEAVGVSRHLIKAKYLDKDTLLRGKYKFESV